MIRATPLTVLLALLIAAAAPGAAHADAKTEAQARMDKATALFKARKFADALNELTVAYTLDPRPEMLYAIGQMHVQLGNCPQAILFYERFLSTKPEAVPAAAATEAIEACRTSPDAIAKDAAAPPPEAQSPPPPRRDAPPRWYADKLGGALAAGGLVLGAAGVVVYLSARGDLDDAEAASDLQAHDDLVDRAHGKRTLAAVLGAVSVGVTGAAITRYVLVRRAGTRATVGVAPARGGGLVTWAGRF